MVNWPTAFVITVIILSGVFLYNKSILAGSGVGGMISTLGYEDFHSGSFFQVNSRGHVRYCINAIKTGVDVNGPPDALYKIRCTTYTDG